MQGPRYSRIVVTGHTGSGKTTFAMLLAEELNAAVLNSGDALREVLEARGIVVRNRLSTGSLFLSEIGERSAGEAVLRCARDRGAIIVEGLRLFSMYEWFLECGETVLLVFVTIPDEIRLRRFRDRLMAAERKSVGSAEHAIAIKDAYSAEVERFRGAADVIVDNSGSLGDLKKFALEVSRRFRHGRSARLPSGPS